MGFPPAQRNTAAAKWGGGVAVTGAAFALITITVPWVKIYYRTFTLGELADSGIGGSISGSASAAVIFYLLGGLTAAALGIIGIAASTRNLITIAAIGTLVAGLVLAVATMIGLSMLDELGPDSASGGFLLGGFAALVTFAGGAVLLAGRG
ncbi:hypothetical protein [Nocardia lasii]|uniref:Major facilitator superfamily (MFS) profile domain-containing protein n=1 Tax=Nocardia lasii TaxID=1616107 RepID=A0ABW1JNR7_9NOCA